MKHFITPELLHKYIDGQCTDAEILMLHEWYDWFEDLEDPLENMSETEQEALKMLMLEKFKRFSWVEFNILTGRTHQIRLHAQHIGNSIICDELYGFSQPIFLSTLKHKYTLSKKEEAEKPILSRLALHAASLKFNLNNKEYFFEAPLPKDLKALLQQLRKLALA